MKYYVKPTELQKIGREIKEELQEEYINQVNKLMELKNKLEWEGQAKDKFVIIYEEKINKLSQFSHIINNMGDFMVYSSSKYDSKTEEVETEYKKYNSKIKEDIMKNT